MGGRVEDKAQRDVVDVRHREVRLCSPAPQRLTGSRDELYKTDFYEKTIDDERMFLDMDKTWVVRHWQVKLKFVPADDGSASTSRTRSSLVRSAWTSRRCQSKEDIASGRSCERLGSPGSSEW
jgi:hypothetical protein